MTQTAAVKPTFIVPATVPGEKMAEFVRRAELFSKSDVVNFNDTGTTINLFELPPNALITGVLVHVKTPFDASGTSAAATATITIPNDTGTEVIWDAANVGLQSTGFKPATGYALTPASGGYAILNYTLNTTTAGALEVFLSYVQLADRL